ncbi:calcium-activated chloride channel-domain-containing protein [Rhodocollybia butyracea]|uniref:Calcium-activated chloride channel-domain-containing protein n=1 Tax=Rhodocollybia butyracea TaxID=206335 RepID=A0A9P5Q3K2_9AGAR|nr:calcium-activated chloride channel-domain-containing protein [Rhodocollybia butyracea]
MQMFDVDFVISFRSSKSSVSSKQTKEEATKAEAQYSRLLQTLTHGGLNAVGRRGDSLGHLLVFVYCPDKLLKNLIIRERQSDFLSGLPVTPVTRDTASETQPLAPSDRLRLVHAYITSIPADGGLGVTPGASEWDLIDSVYCLHDRAFNETWIHAWTTSKIASVSSNRIREQFGESVALYFAFLDSYTRALVLPAVLGVSFYFFGTSYSPIYSLLTVLWAIGFVEWWRVRERLIALRFGTRGSFRVEKRRAQYDPKFPWWKREIRILASLPIILAFVALLSALMTGIFVFEAFVTQLYTGPGHKFISFSPTVIFVILVPRLVSIFQMCAQYFTRWENHAHHSSHNKSLTLKTFIFNALVAYLGLALSAFVYVPFGEGLMRIVQVWLFQGSVPHTGDEMNVNLTETTVTDQANIWDNDLNAESKLNHGRLKDQMFAYTVTNQIVNTFVEIGLPYITRKISTFRTKKAPSSGSSNGKKKVVFEDEKEKGGQVEKEFLERAREEAALEEYDVFGDYSEMVIQFGYVVLWSTIWPLAPVMALLNNILELRSDAFKITVHERRPTPVRTDTIGPWLDALAFLSWMAALTNGALVYLFCPREHSHCTSESAIERVHRHLVATASKEGVDGLWGEHGKGLGATKELLIMALLVALAASHGYLVVQALMKHIMERLLWKGSDEVKEREREERMVKEVFLKGIGGVEVDTAVSKTVDAANGEGNTGFWDHDEGMDEIRRLSSST